MSTLLSFCSDCDLMTRRGFEEVHAFFGSIDLPCGDSFWLFDPSGGDMGLFTFDVDHPGPQHAWLLDKISAGILDVIHSAGSYGERFNQGYRPSRDQIEKALAYLKRYAVVPRIWTNHGDSFNTQNIGGAHPALHHQGDLLGSDTYCLDVLRNYGIEYFWLDRLIWRDSKLPYRLTATERCRDGNEITTFMRYLAPAVDWSPNGQNFPDQLRASEFQNLAANRQDTVLYTHWGCHHEGRTAMFPQGDSLTRQSRNAILSLVQQFGMLDLRVVRLPELLDKHRGRPVHEEIQRIGAVVVRPEKEKQDCFYFNQYAKHGLDYFRRRLKGMGVSGRRALDAGCGVGQWSYAMCELFEEVKGVEMNPDALVYLDQISSGLRLTGGPSFVHGSIESLPYDDEYFDFILCYGVLFCTSFRRSLQEFSRVLSRGGRAYVCINGDGWYEYLIDERFRDRADDFLLPFAEPIWNALVARVGGESNFTKLIRTAQDVSFSWRDVNSVRAVHVRAVEDVAPEHAVLVREYSERVIGLLGELSRRQLDLVPEAVSERRPSFRCLISKIWPDKIKTHTPNADVPYLPMDGIGSRNRALLPQEFASMAELFGLRMVEHGGDSALCKDEGVSSIYASTFNRHDSVWECLLIKR